MKKLRYVYAQAGFTHLPAVEHKAHLPGLEIRIEFLIGVAIHIKSGGSINAARVVITQ
jgi:hypothetical protein